MYTIKVGRPRAQPKTISSSSGTVRFLEAVSVVKTAPGLRSRADWRIVLEKREEQACLGYFGSSITRGYALMTLVRMTLGTTDLFRRDASLSVAD